MTHSAPTAREALAELVACKDLKDRADACGYMPAGEAMSEYIAATEEYERRWPLAWSAARSALSAAAPDHTALIERLRGWREIREGEMEPAEWLPVWNEAVTHMREAAAALESGVPEQQKTITSNINDLPEPDVTDYTKCECCASSYEQGHRDGYQAGYTQGMNDRGNPN